MSYKPKAKDILCITLIILILLIAGHSEYKTQQTEASLGYLTITETR